MITDICAAFQGKQRVLHHWDSASEDFGASQSPRISTRVADLPAIPEYPDAASAATAEEVSATSPEQAVTAQCDTPDTPAAGVLSEMLLHDGLPASNHIIADPAIN